MSLLDNIAQIQSILDDVKFIEQSWNKDIKSSWNSIR